MAAAPWSSGDEVDVLVGQGDTGQWWPATVLEIDRSGEVGRVRLQRAVGALRPPRSSSAAPSEESGVPLGRIAPAGTHVPRWRLCGGGEPVEVKVRARVRCWARTGEMCHPSPLATGRWGVGHIRWGRNGPGRLWVSHGPRFSHLAAVGVTGVVSRTPPGRPHPRSLGDAVGSPKV